MWLYVYVIICLISILILKWVYQRNQSFKVLQKLGYKVPPTEFIGGNLLNLFMG